MSLRPAGARVCTAADVDAEAAALAGFVRVEAPGWYPDLGDGVAAVTVVSSSVRIRSRNHRLRIHGRGGSHDVLAKVTSFEEEPAPASARPPRPMLGTPSDFDEKHALEYGALALAHEHLGQGDDPRVASVRALAHIPERRTLILEYVEAANLATLVRSQSFRRRRSSSLAPAFAGAGAWLRAYHGLAKPVAGARRATRSELCADLMRYGQYLADQGQGRRFLDEIVVGGEGVVTRVLPEQLPLALGHGDAAMRNVLVLPDDRVAMFDMLGRWAVPIYEDIAYFTLSVRLNGLQGVTQGVAFQRPLLRRYEEAFLAGYFGSQPVPRAAISAYELLVLLDRWAAQADAPLPRPGPRRTAQMIVNRALCRAFRCEAAQIVEDVHASKPS